MRKTGLTLPEVGFLAATRGALGAGAALLLADRLNKEQRKAAGWTLFLIGAVTTVPLAMLVLRRRSKKW